MQKEPHGANVPEDYPKPGALRERFITNGKYSYFARLDDYKELNMTPFGKMKLSVIPEGVIYSTYNYFKTQTIFPSYDKFFDSCLMHTREADIDMKPRWRRFYDVCKLKAIDSNSPPSLPSAFTDGPRVFSSEKIEEEFWRVEKYKLTPKGIKVMEKIGDPQNPYRTQMMEICDREIPDLTNKELFDLYLFAYPKTNPNVNPMEPSFKNLIAYEAYIEQLLHRQDSTDCKDPSHPDQEVQSQHEPPA